MDGLDRSLTKRLYDISWLMKFLNEGVARRANKEDNCTGYFWEAIFKSQALLDEQAVLSAMTYVDLNPIKAAMANTPEQSDHTSIQLRIAYWKKRLVKNLNPILMKISNQSHLCLSLAKLANPCLPDWLSTCSIIYSL